MIDWDWKRFDEMSGEEVHEMLALRQAVFVVEQQCAYQDADHLDRVSWHLLGRGSDGRLAAYARVNDPGTRHRRPSIGRVLTAAHLRGRGAGRALMGLCLEKCRAEYPGVGIRISAQTYLTRFYAGFGFQAVGQPYDEDGVEHVDMVLAVGGDPFRPTAKGSF
jgi:ElaA protein